MNSLTETYNLLHENWIPVLRRSGAADWIAPWRITEGLGDHGGDPVLALAAPRPDFNGALHEFLIGLLATCFAPEDEGAWARLWRDPPAPDELQQAFLKYQHAFNLDGDGPRFMQDFDELDGDPAPVANLLMEQPGSNTLVRNADHFIKRGGATALGRPGAAMALFTLQTYAPSGGAGHRTSLRGGGPLTTLVISGSGLWDRLWPNVETAQQIEDRRSSDAGGDTAIFPWLAPTQTSEKGTGRSVAPDKAHPLQVYWGMPRRIRLIFTPAEADGDLCAVTRQRDDLVVKSYALRNYGIDYSDGWIHPLSPYYQQRANDPLLLPMHPQPGGVSYRHWLGLVLAGEDNLKRPAKCVINALSRPRSRYLRKPKFCAFGYDVDNMKARGWVDSEMPLFDFDDEAVQRKIEELIPRLVKSAEVVAGQLTGCVKRALFDNPKDAKGDFSHISDRFWRETEAGFFALLGAAKQEVSKSFSSPLDDVNETEDQRAAIGEKLAREWLGNYLRPVAERVFDELASSGDIEFKNMARLVSARFSLISLLRGAGKKASAPGAKLYQVLGLVTPYEQAKRENQIKETGA